jgi:hypothetical protein
MMGILYPTFARIPDNQGAKGTFAVTLDLLHSSVFDVPRRPPKCLLFPDISLGALFGFDHGPKRWSTINHRTSLDLWHLQSPSCIANGSLDIRHFLTTISCLSNTRVSRKKSNLELQS